MYSLLLTTTLFASALASNKLVARQGGESFVPDTSLVSSCRAGEFECPGEYQGTKYCSDPARGDKCCKQGYNCPGGSYCLIDGYCCPDGLDAATCAANNGVSLPDNFGASSVAPVTTEAPETASTTAVLVTSSSSAAPVITAVVTPSVASPPYVIPGNATLPVGTATGSGTGSVPGQTGVTPFTGAGNVNAVGVKGAMVVLGAGVVGAML